VKRIDEEILKKHRKPVELPKPVEPEERQLRRVK
jgi:hypothetical protein